MEDTIMKLTGKLKEQVEKAETREEAKKIMEEAGISLTDEELDQVAGGLEQFDGEATNTQRGVLW